MVGQAVPSVAPGKASRYFNKTECFCFTQQPLAAGETKDMPLRFIVDPNLPKDVSTLTLAYTVFDVTTGGDELDRRSVYAMTGPRATDLNQKHRHPRGRHGTYK